MILLKDAPGGPEFIRQFTESAAELGLAFAGEPDDRVAAALECTRKNMERKLSEDLGAKTAAEIAKSFVSAVLYRRDEIQRANPSMIPTKTN